MTYFLRDETGLELSEYAVAAALIAMASRPWLSRPWVAQLVTALTSPAATISA